MKEEFVNDVLRDMLPYLDNKQASKLQKILLHELCGYELQRAEDQSGDDVSENLRLMNVAELPGVTVGQVVENQRLNTVNGICVA